MGNIVETVAEDAAKGAVSAVGGGSFLPWIIIAALVALIGSAGGGFYKGWTMRGTQDDAKFALAQQKAEHEWQGRIDAANARGDQIAADLEKEKANVKTVTVTVVKYIPKVTTVYKDKPNAPAIPIPHGVYTWGFVRLLNDALDPTVKHDVSQAAGVPAGEAASADIVRAPIDTPDVLGNAVENAGKYADCRAQLNALIDWHEKNPTEYSGAVQKQ
jgi:hypothetical protein